MRTCWLCVFGLMSFANEITHTTATDDMERERQRMENGWIRQLSTLSDYYAKLNDLFIFIYRLPSERFKFNAKLRNGTGHTITDSDNADPKTIYDCGASKSKSRAHLLHVSICRMVAKIFHVPFQMMAAHDHQAISIIKSNGYFSTRHTFSTSIPTVASASRVSDRNRKTRSCWLRCAQ